MAEEKSGTDQVSGMLKAVGDIFKPNVETEFSEGALRGVTTFDSIAAETVEIYKPEQLITDSVNLQSLPVVKQIVFDSSAIEKVNDTLDRLKSAPTNIYGFDDQVRGINDVDSQVSVIKTVKI